MLHKMKQFAETTQLARHKIIRIDRMEENIKGINSHYGDKIYEFPEKQLYQSTMAKNPGSLVYEATMREEYNSFHITQIIRLVL